MQTAKLDRQVDDWVEVFCTQVDTRAEARAMEKQIKARGAKRFLAERKDPGI